MKIKDVLPGLTFVVFIAVIVRSAHKYLPNAYEKLLSEVVVGMLVGLIIGNFIGVSDLFKSGIRLSFGLILKLAIVLLGVRISISKIIAVGGTALLLVIFLIILALIVTYFLGKWLGVSSKLAALIGVGTAVCGNTAISAIAPAIKAKDEEMSFAIAVNTLFGTCAVFLYPLLGEYLHLSDTFFGFWAGTAVNDTSQVVATGFSYSNNAGDWATTVKLTRNALMGFVIVAMTFVYAQKDNKNTSFISKIKLPMFVVMFLIVAAINSLGFFHWLEGISKITIIGHISWLTKFLILIALIGVGLNTRFTSMKNIGWRPFLLGLFVGLIVSCTSFTLIYFLKLG
ncbi:YeiH family protein [Candidatus Uabimicrobium sp. HlEnr_7]|uniref:YeiH family protein n=1 Tax=Candidatus Uabimicrobium helgolandensis TaxID=3095367 RepID=UPI003557F4E4